MDGVRIEPGGVSDYRLLARWHYRAGAPAVPVLVVRASVCGEPAGVLVVTRPVLNGRWREAAWPGWLAGMGKRERAAEMNARLRTVARLVVAPAFRGCGVGSGLVRAYLADPLTERTEALSAMGALCPVFERAGMRRVARPPGRAEARALSALRGAGVPPWRLADPSVRRRAARDGGVARALRGLAFDRWRAGRGASAEELMERLWPAVASRAAAFVHERPGGSGRG